MGLITRASYSGHRRRTLAIREIVAPISEAEVGRVVRNVVAGTPTVTAALGGRQARLFCRDRASGWGVGFEEHHPRKGVRSIWEAAVVPESRDDGTTLIAVGLVSWVQIDNALVSGARDFEAFCEKLFDSIKAAEAGPQHGERDEDLGGGSKPRPFALLTAENATEADSEEYPHVDPETGTFLREKEDGQENVLAAVEGISMRRLDIRSDFAADFDLVRCSAEIAITESRILIACNVGRADLVGHVRYPWLEAVLFRAGQRPKIALVMRDPATDLLCAVILRLVSQLDAAYFARDIAVLAAVHLLEFTCGTDDEFATHLDRLVASPEPSAVSDGVLAFTLEPEFRMTDGACALLSD